MSYSSWRQIPRLLARGGALGAGAAVAVFCSSNSLTTSFDGGRTFLSKSSTRDDEDDSSDNDNRIVASSERISVHFVHKLAGKFYLQLPGIFERPPAIPRTLRILTIDLPEVAEQGIAGGQCHSILDQYPAGVAPPRKRLILPAENDTDTAAAGSRLSRKRKAEARHHQTLEIQQKAWVHAYLQCSSRRQDYGVNSKSEKPPKKKKTPKYSFDKGPPEDVGVEIMQASMVTLNPRRLRKIHTFVPGSVGAFTNDASSVEETTSNPDNKLSRPEVRRSDKRSTAGHFSYNVPHNLKTKSQLTNLDEQDAPWNQYAWIEELTLRIHGRVHFGAPMQRARRHSFFLSRLYFSNLSSDATIGKSYRTIIPSACPWWETWLIPPFFIRTDPEGIDGGLQYTAQSGGHHHTVNTNNWASHKPHAVIANGATLHRVPNALRLLQKTCHDANVPLYVIRDPRKWGGNTHETLGDVLSDLRALLKRQFVTTSRQLAAGSAFAQGRRLGQIETNAAWHVRNVSRQAAEWIQQTETERQRRRERDWSRIRDADRLEEKLCQHGVVRRVERSSSASLSEKDDDLSTNVERVYSEGIMAFCQRCMTEMQSSLQRQKEATTTHTPTAVGSEIIDPKPSKLPEPKSDNETL